MRRVPLLVKAAVIAAAWATHVLAQDRQYRVGVLATSSLSVNLIREQTLPELAKEGFIEGRNLVVDARVANGSPEQLRALASELTAMRPDAVVAVADTAIRAAFAATRSTPIIMAFGGGDPVTAGFADSLAKPGKNVTGTVILAGELDAKRMQLLIEAVPGISRVAALTEQIGRTDNAIREVAEKMAVEFVGAFPALRSNDYPGAFARMQAAGAQAVLVAATPAFNRDIHQIAPLAIESNMPIICQWREMAEAGCLLAYGPLYRGLRRRTAYYLARVPHGVPPGELPIEQPSRFDLSVNLRTARAMGLELPPFLVLRADEVIE